MRIALLILGVSMVVAIGAAQLAQPSTPDLTGGADPLALPSPLALSSSNLSSARSERPSALRSEVAPSSVQTLPMRSGQSAEVEDETTTPARVRVPSLGLDVDVVPVGVDDVGLFDVPRADQVGWYRHGPSPGEPGSAVLAAHVDFDGELGAFFALRDLLPGDVIELDYVDGTSQAFRVVDQTLYDKTALPADELFRRSGDSVLHLATCGGSFDPVTQSYVGNRVVTAVPIVELVEPGLSQP